MKQYAFGDAQFLSAREKMRAGFYATYFENGEDTMRQAL